MSKKKKSKAEQRSFQPPQSHPIQAKPSSFPFKHLFAIGLIAVLALGSYANTFRVPFVFDDQPNIVENPSVQFTGFSSFWLERLLKDTYQESLRFFAYFTFGLNYYFGKFNVFGYHLINLLIHIASGLLLYGFLLITLNLPSLKERYGSVAFPIALFSSLLFISHPIQTQSVTYIVQRMTSMAAMFYLLSMLLYVKGRLSQGRKRLLCFAGTGAFYLLGLFTKENVAILPLFIALYEFYFFQGLTVRRQEKKILTYAIGAVVLIGLLMLLFWGKRYLDIINEGYQARDFTLGQRVLTQFRVVLYYVTLLIYPHPSRLNLDYDFPISRGIFDPPTTLLSMLIVLGLMGYGLWRAKKRPLVSFFILWYFGNLAIESSIFPLEMVFEHRLYLPAIGPFVLFSVLVVKGWQGVIESRRQKAENRKQETKPSTQEEESRRQKAESGLQQAVPLWAFMLLTSMLLCVGTFQRNKVWKDEVTLWEDCVIKSPKKPRTNYNLGFAYYQSRRYLEAIESLKKAIRLKPDDPEAYNNLGLSYYYLHRYPEAVESLRVAVLLKPTHAKAHNNLGLAYQAMGKMEEAIDAHKRAVQLKPDDAEFNSNLGVAFRKGGRYREAVEVYQKVIEIKPDLSDFYNNLGLAYYAWMKFQEAIDAFKKAIQLDSKKEDYYYNIGVTYTSLKDYQAAAEAFQRAIEINPSYSPARFNLGLGYLMLNKKDLALNQYRVLMSLDEERAKKLFDLINR